MLMFFLDNLLQCHAHVMPAMITSYLYSAVVWWGIFFKVFLCPVSFVTWYTLQILCSSYTFMLTFYVLLPWHMLCTTPTEHLAAKLNTVTGPQCDEMFVTNYFVWFKRIYTIMWNVAYLALTQNRHLTNWLFRRHNQRGLKAAVQDCKNH